MLAQVPGHRAPWAWHLAESPFAGGDKCCSTLKPSAHSPNWGGRAGCNKLCSSLPLPFLFLLEILSCTLRHHTYSKSKQGGVRKCEAMSDRLMPLQVQPSRAQRSTKKHCHLVCLLCFHNIGTTKLVCWTLAVVADIDFCITCPGMQVSRPYHNISMSMCSSSCWTFNAEPLISPSHSSNRTRLSGCPGGMQPQTIYTYSPCI